jgi:AcrR family transcriptional regulator
MNEKACLDVLQPKAPAQKRSRERVERMLAAAVELIERDGSDAMRMSEVAQKAGVPIGSLYQFFPDKTAIIRTLADRTMAEGRACIAAGLEGVTTPAGLLDAFDGLIDIYYGAFLARPVMRDIWSATQADARLRALELEDSRMNGALVAEAVHRLRPGLDRASLDVPCLLVMQLGEAAMRLAVSVERGEGDALIQTYKAMARSTLGGLLAR